MTEISKPGIQQDAISVNTSESSNLLSTSIRDPHNAILTERAKIISNDMDALQMQPAEIIQGGVLFTSASHEDPDRQKRPFAVIKTTSLPLSTVEYTEPLHMIYKARVGDPDEVALTSAQNEQVFLDQIVPIVREHLPQGLEHRILFPRIITVATDQENTDHFAFLEEYFEGEPGGTIHKVDTSVLQKDDLFAIAQFIKTLETVDLDGAEKLLKLNHYGMDLFIEHIEERAEMIDTLLGTDYINKAVKLLYEKENFVREAKPLFAAIDINPSNILKNEQGQIMIIDWERVGKTTNPATDYDLLFTDLWGSPQLQEEYFQYVIGLNKDIPNFKEQFRLDFIFNHGSGVLHYWYNLIHQNNIPEDVQQEAVSAIVRLSSLLKDAISQEGIWSKEEAV